MTMYRVLLAKTAICHSREEHKWWYVGHCAQDDHDYGDGEDDHIGRDEESTPHFAIFSNMIRLTLEVHLLVVSSPGFDE